MTIKQCLSKKGMIADCEVKGHRCGEVCVYFHNTDENRDDSTCFDIMFPLGSPLKDEGIDELDKLYKEFCKENNIPRNTVDEIHLTCVAENMDELAKIC